MKRLRSLYRQFTGGMYLAPFMILWGWWSFHHGDNGGYQLSIATVWIVLYVVFRAIYKYKVAREK